MTLDRHAFEFYSSSLKKWILEDGDFDLLLAENAEETIARITVRMTDGDRPFLYRKTTPLIWFLKNDVFHGIIRKQYLYLADFFNPEKTEFLILLYPAPICKFLEPVMGKPLFTESQLDDIIKVMNQEE